MPVVDTPCSILILIISRHWMNIVFLWFSVNKMFISWCLLFVPYLAAITFYSIYNNIIFAVCDYIYFWKKLGGHILPPSFDFIWLLYHTYSFLSTGFFLPFCKGLCFTTVHPIFSDFGAVIALSEFEYTLYIFHPPSCNSVYDVISWLL